ncbi:unnamed protein product [Plutella xylostella]|uniref:(diamondback moth) hypothetical protein n=1 Tax=Plutella xylostella TaxID=51655 RepID=A0A8S4G1W4_PLUXY|nr:unnamed protein product [Plutella xylostella]
MGRKRKNEERIRRKIKKYEDRLAYEHRRRQDRSGAPTPCDLNSQNGENYMVPELRNEPHMDSPTFYDWEDAGTGFQHQELTPGAPNKEPASAMGAGPTPPPPAP